MRSVFLNYLLTEAANDSRIYLVADDTGFSVIEPFKERFPQRYINAGIAEQNMIGISAGLAMAGKKVYVYGIIPFMTMRCFEQIRLDLCYHQDIAVTIIGVGGGFSYGPMAATHHALEDVALMRILPHMTVVAPGSKYEVSQLASQIHEVNGPCYLRLGNNEEAVTYPPTPLILGKALEIIPHDEVLIIATGNALDLGYAVCTYLNNQGVSAGLVSMHTIKPLDIDYLRNKMPHLKALFTVEEHFIAGGLGEQVAYVIAEHAPKKIIFKAFGINDFYFHETGTRKYLLKKAGLSTENIVHEIKERLGITANVVIPAALHTEHQL